MKSTPDPAEAASEDELSEASAPTTRPSIDEVKARVAKRLRDQSSADRLVDAWIHAVTDQALSQALTSGPLPATLTAQRADLLMFVCQRLKRLVSEREVEVLFRLTPASARTIHRQMKAIYEDQLEMFVLEWALADARLDGGGEHEGVEGWRIVLPSKDSLDAAVRELKGLGIPFARKRDDANLPFLLYVGKEIEIERFALPTTKVKPSRSSRRRRS